MTAFGPIAFAAPWALAALLTLPAIWWLARATPPPPRRQTFPALRLLLGVRKEDETPQRTPWPLLLLRMAAVAVVILALSGPIWRPSGSTATGPLVIAVDDGWAAAPGWTQRRAAMRGLVAEAAEARRPVYLFGSAPRLGQTPALAPLSRDAARGAARALEPSPLAPDRAAWVPALNALAGELRGTADVHWLSDGVDYGSAEAFAAALARLGRMRVRGDRAENAAWTLSAPKVTPDGVTVAATRAADSGRLELRVGAFASDGRFLGDGPVVFDDGARVAEATVAMPLETANTVTALRILGRASTGSVALMDESNRRRLLGVVAGRDDANQPLLAGPYYLNRALDPIAEIVEGDLGALLAQEADVLLMPDVGRVVGPDAERLGRWVEGGGLLVRFAGPRMATSADDFVPARLRRGDRSLGGALSWGEPQRIAPFPESSPFAGLRSPEDARIRRQVLAEPSLDLAEKTWARLEDGTPLVTAAPRGQGWIVLFHVTADPSWSDIPLSGVFPQMLQRVIPLAQGGPRADRDAGREPAPPLRALDGFGALQPPEPGVRALAPDETPRPTPETPPGLYGGESRTVAVNAAAAEPYALLRDAVSVPIREFERGAPRSLRGALLTAALLLFAIEGVAAAAMSGRLPHLKLRPAASAAALGFAVFAAVAPAPVRAADVAETRALEGASETRLAYVRTGERQVDDVSRAGLYGLSRRLRARTAAEVADPVGVDPERDELVFYPLLYWPVTPTLQPLSPEGAARVDAYLKTGGAVLFDTRDEGTVRRGGETPEGRALRELLAGLDVPPLAPAPEDHVLTRSFYLLPAREFPGRWTGGRVWLDGVTPPAGGAIRKDDVASILIGGHDWAAAWAEDASGRPLYAVVPGGYRQREYAYRFGVNLVMYTLTGNYKKDLVHVGPLLQRLGE